VKIETLILNGGPTKSRFWNQVTANVVNLPLSIPDVDEAAPLGDAVLAGVGAGFYPDPVTPVNGMVRIRETIEPDRAMHERYEAFFSLWSDVYEQLKGSMDRHRALLEKYRLGGNG
jgi:xylulokinase